VTFDWLVYSLSITFYKYPDITLSFVHRANHYALYKASIDSFICLVPMRPPTQAAAACPFRPLIVSIHSLLLLFTPSMPILFYCFIEYLCVDNFPNVPRSCFVFTPKVWKYFPVITRGGAKSEALFPTPMVNTWFATIPIRVKQSADEGYWKAQSNSHVVWAKCKLFSFNYTM